MPQIPDKFPVDVEGIGRFMFAKRTIRREFAILSIHSDLVGGTATPSPMLDDFASAFATIKGLLVQGPDGWDIESLDPLDDDTWTQISRIQGALRAREVAFRQGPNPAVQADSTQAVQDDRVLVPSEVQPAAD